MLPQPPPPPALEYPMSSFLSTFQATAIFQALNQDDYKIVLNTIENAILATDLALYFKWVVDFLLSIISV